MKDGFIKLVLASPEIKVGDVRANSAEIEKIIRAQNGRNTGLLVFPELSLTGATCGDLLKQSTLTTVAQAELVRLAGVTAEVGFPVVVGLPFAFRGKVFNAGAVLSAGQVQGIVPAKVGKGVFASFAYDTESVEIAGTEVPVGSLIFSAKDVPDFTFGIEVGADGEGVLPMSAYLVEAGANLVCSMTARPATVGSVRAGVEELRVRSAIAKCALARVGAGPTESVTDALYSGERTVCVAGEVIGTSELISSGVLECDVDLGAVAFLRRECEIADGAFARVELPVSVQDVELTTQVKKSPFVNSCEKTARRDALEVLEIQSSALARRMAHIGAKSLVIGISGGLDSTIALLVCAKAVDKLGLPRTAIKAVSMPGFGTSKKTRGNAEIVSERLGTDFSEISIEGAVRRHFEDIGHDENVHDVTYENSQARERTQILMDLANKTGGIVVGTGDLSEVALGFATYNGDHMSMYGVNASVPKTLIRKVISVYAEGETDVELARALFDVVATPVSPELLPTNEGEIAQITEDIVGPYELHDFFLYHLVERGAGPRKIFRLAQKAFDGEYDGVTIKKWLKRFLQRFFAQQFKRSCMPDGVQVTDVSLSPRGAWAMPSEASVSAWLEELN